MSEPLLALSDVRAGYGSSIVLDGISFELPERGGLAVLGRNGVGKSTLLLTIMGYTQVSRGRVLWRGEDASVDAVLLAMAIVGEQHKLDLVRRGGDANLGLITKPAARSEQHKDENENNGNVVLPSATFIGPKKRLGENLLQAGHVNPLEHRQRSRRRACARHGRSK